jgi:hypothetical protein
MKIFFTFLLVGCTHFIQAQIIYSKIPLQDIVNGNNQLGIQGLVLNDSIFMAGYPTKNGPAKAFWILPSGEVVKLNSPELKNKLVVALASSGDSTYFYYLEQLKYTISLRAVVQSQQTGVITSSNKSISFTGSFVNIFHQGQHTYLLSIFKERNEIRLSEIKGIERLNETFLISAVDLNTNLSPFSFVSENEILSPLAAASPNKIYQQGNFLYIGIDQTKALDGMPKTSILKINLNSGESELRIIVDNAGKQFRTYIENDYIFKITKSRSAGAIISIYDLADFSLRQTMKINKETAIAQNRSYKKDFAKTTDKESVWDAISNTSSSFIMATPTDSVNFIVRVGTHHLVDRSGAGFIPVVSAFQVLAIVGAVARVAALSLSEMESVDHYFYLKWDGKNELAYADKPVSAIQAIDTYDITMFKQKRKFEYKGYLQTHSKVFGFYQESGSKFLDIILFETP